MIPQKLSDRGSTLKQIFKRKLNYSFNVLRAGKVFKDGNLSLVTGGEDGILRVHKCNMSRSSNELVAFEDQPRKLETKAGPIMTLSLENLTNFHSVDILVGDSRGMLTIFTKNQILSRRSLVESSISSITFERDPVGNMTIILGSLDGTLLAVSPYSTLFKQRLGDSLNGESEDLVSSLQITCLHHLKIISSITDATYIVVADNKNCLHFFQKGTRIRTLFIPSEVTCICSGYFIQLDASLNQDSPMSVLGSPTKTNYMQHRGEDQIAVGTKDGRIFIISGFSVIPYANIGTCLTNILSVKSSFYNFDTILCTGDFNSIYIFRDGREVAQYKTTDWIHTLDIISLDNITNKYLFVGCLDANVEILSLEI